MNEDQLYAQLLETQSREFKETLAEDLKQKQEETLRKAKQKTLTFFRVEIKTKHNII